MQPALAQETGAIRGSVYDLDYQVPLDGVRVTVVGTSLRARTSDDGSFLIEGVPPGEYKLSFAKAAYERWIERDVIVVAGRMAPVRIDLVPQIYTMEEVVVTGEDFLADTELGLLEIRAEAVTVQDSISSELIKKAGASDVAGALKLVVGASVAEGKYATVRGLSDRYTGTTLHGVRIPSADPRRRATQIDLFPTGTIESVTVTKTFTPDLQGDFSGGGVDIVTKSVPESLVLSFSTGVEYDTEATSNPDFLSYEGGGVKLMDDGDRGLDSRAAGRFPEFPAIGVDPDAADIARSALYDDLTRSFSPVMGVSTDEPGLNRGFQFVVGDRFLLGDNVLGVMAAYTQKRNWESYEGGKNNKGALSDASQGTSLDERNDALSKEEILSGAVVNFTLLPNDKDELTLRLIGNYAAEDAARFQSENLGGGTFEQNQTLRYTERTVGSAQLQGKHRFPETSGGTWGEISMDWTVADSLTEQDEPDVRFFRNIYDSNNLGFRMPSNSTDPQNTRRTWREIEEDDGQLSANVTLPFSASWTARPGSVRAGIYGQVSDRDYEQSSFTYFFPQQVGGIFDPARACNIFASEYQAGGPGELWTDHFFDPGNIGLAPEIPNCSFNEIAQAPTPAPNQLLWVLIPTGDDVNYDAAQKIRAGYGMTDFPITEKLNAIVGARYEATDLEIDPHNALFGTVELIELSCDPKNPLNCSRSLVTVPQEEGAADIDESFLLPSVGLVWEVIPNMNIRATWAETIARPTFRELAPVATEEFLQGDEFVGNPDIVLSEVSNYDLRWEWFRRPGELFAFSAFYKELTDPIELISFSSNNRSFIQPVNFDTGEVVGTELEARVDIGRYLPFVEGLAVGANYTVLDSEVDVPLFEQYSLGDGDDGDGDEIPAGLGLGQESRALQGQPEFLTNAYVTYDNNRTGTSVGVFYNRRGETLVTGAARGVEDGTPDVYDRARTNIDVTFRQTIGDHFALSLKAKNITRSDAIRVYRIPGDTLDVVKTRVETGSRYSLSASVQW